MQSAWERDGSGGMSQRKVMNNTEKVNREQLSAASQHRRVWDSALN